MTAVPPRSLYCMLCPSFLCLSNAELNTFWKTNKLKENQNRDIESETKRGKKWILWPWNMDEALKIGASRCIFHPLYVYLMPNDSICSLYGACLHPPHHLCRDTGRSQGLRVSFLPQVALPCWGRQEVSAPLCVNLFSSPWLKAAELPNPDHPPLLQLWEMRCGPIYVCGSLND